MDKARTKHDVSKLIFKVREKYSLTEDGGDAVHGIEFGF
jgi:hypothetical protein